jgi:hypothetical protein
LLKTLSEEKNSIDKKYTNLSADINNFMGSTKKCVVEKIVAKMKRNCEEQFSVELRRMAMEMNVLLEEKKK